MSERWIPVVAAIVGVLGGMGGAFIGGYVANKGEQQRFKEEQVAKTENFRRDTVVKFLAAAEKLRFAGGTGQDLLADEAQVSLLFPTSVVRAAAREVSHAARISTTGENDLNYRRTRDRFIRAARDAMTGGG
jgi:hypothetical protein